MTTHHPVSTPNATPTVADVLARKITHTPTGHRTVWTRTIWSLAHGDSCELGRLVDERRAR